MYERSVDRLGDEIAQIAAHITSGSARLLDLLAEFDEREGWAGFQSCAQWLEWRCGFSHRTALEHVRVARDLTRLPALSAKMREGTLSFSKVRAVTRMATPATEALLVEWAQHATAAQLERIARGVRAARSCEDPVAMHRQRSLTTRYLENGLVEIRVLLTPDVAAMVLAAIERATEELAAEEPAEAGTARSDGEPAARSAERDDSEGDPFDFDAPSLTQRRDADALALLAERYVALAVPPGPPKPLVVVHTNEQMDQAWLADGGVVPAETLARLACDAGVVRIADDTMTIERESREIPRAMRRKLWQRDRHCRYPGCRSRRVDAHHIVWWSRGGHTSLDNLALLCRRHHRLVHEDGYSIVRMRPGEFELRRPDGRPLRRVSPPGRGSALARAHRGVNAATAGVGSGGRRKPDYDLAVGGLLNEEAMGP